MNNNDPVSNRPKERPDVARNLLKVLVFCLIVLVAQWLISTRFTQRGFHNLHRLNRFLSSPMDVLYLGDSSDWYAPVSDTDKRPMSVMLTSMLPRAQFKRISHGAYHLEVYAAYCRYISKHSSKQKKDRPVIIIPINMRTFSPHWDLEPHYQFDREKAILEGGVARIFYTPLQVFKYKFSTISRKDYVQTPVYYQHRKIGVVGKMRGTKNQFMLKYMTQLTPNHRKVKALQQILRMVSKNQLTVLFYVTPIDFEKGEHYWPRQFKKALRQNIAQLRSLFRERKSGHCFIDLSQKLESHYFAWKGNGSVNEHLNQDGRHYVASQLAAHLKSNGFADTNTPFF